MSAPPFTVCHLTSVDADTGARLAGATFALYNDTEGTLIGYYKTDSNGYLVTSQLTLNYTYSFVEVGAPDGYVLDGTPHTVQLTSSLSSSADAPYVLTISNTAESAVLSAEVESEETEAAEIVATDEEAGRSAPASPVYSSGKRGAHKLIFMLGDMSSAEELRLAVRACPHCLLLSIIEVSAGDGRYVSAGTCRARVFLPGCLCRRERTFVSGIWESIP